MGIEETIVLVKPEGVEFLEVIKKKLTEPGLRITKEWWVFVTPPMIDELYAGDPPALREMAVRHFGNRENPVLLVEGPGAILITNAIVGTEISPGRCACRTIRRKFGETTPRRILVDGVVMDYWYNVVHTPRDSTEAARNIQTVRLY